jgi:hypothetical protein
MTSFKARKTMLRKSMCCEIVENGAIHHFNSSDRRFLSFQASLALDCVGKRSLTSFHAQELKACERQVGEIAFCCF